jgi:transposase InsO family protein
MRAAEMSPMRGCALELALVQRRVRVNGDVVRGAFIIDAHDREVIAWRDVVNAGIRGSDIGDLMLEAVERRFGTCRAPSPIEML